MIRMTWKEVMSKYKKLLIALVVILIFVLIIIVNQEERPINQNEQNDALEDDLEIQDDEQADLDDLIDVKDPYGSVKTVDQLPDDLRGARDIFHLRYSDQVIYVFDHDIYIVNEDGKGHVLHNDYKITKYDKLDPFHRVGYLVETDENKTVLYVYDYENDLLEVVYESESGIGDLSWIDSEKLLVLKDDDDNHIYSFNVNDKSFTEVMTSLENQKYIKLIQNGYEYIGIQVRFWDENQITYKDQLNYLKKEDLSVEMLAQENEFVQSINRVEDFKDYLKEDVYSVIEAYDDVILYRLDWDMIGLQVGDKKYLLNEYAASLDLSPNKSKLAVVSGEQDAWSGMFVYDLETFSKQLVINGYGDFAPKEALWLDDDHILFVYGLAGGHFSLGGSLYVYNLKSDEKNLAKLSEPKEELFNIQFKDDLIEVTSRRFNETVDFSIVDSILVDKTFNTVKDAPSILSNQSVEGLDTKEEFRKYFIIHDLEYEKKLIASMDGYLPRESSGATAHILLALIGLEEGFIKIEDTLRKWDGTNNTDESWNRDQTLESAMKNDVTWYFEQLEREIGKDIIVAYLQEVAYGYYKTLNDEANTWQLTTLDVSSHDQVNFMTKLYKNDLNFKQEYLDLIKSLMIINNQDDYSLSGKTGTSVGYMENDIAWFTGYIKNDVGSYTFSTMLDGDNVNAEQAISYTKNVLKILGIIK